MRFKQKIFVAIMAASVVAPGAMAADFPREDDTMFVDSNVPADAGWSGFYAGAYADYKWISATVSPGSDLNHVNGIGGGGYLGYNIDLSNGLIMGLEGTVGLSAADGSANGTSLNQDWDSSLRARMGYAFEQNMIYGLAGLAASAFDLENANGSDQNTHLGWVVGAGIETQLTDNLVGRAEYGYTDYNTRDYSLGNGTTELSPSGHSVKLGVGLKF